MPRYQQVVDAAAPDDGGAIMRAGIRSLAGWLFLGGVLLGALGAWARLPYAWTTAAAQVSVAVGRTPEWMRASWLRRGPALQRAIAAAPNDAALHVAGAALDRIASWSEEDTASPP